MVVISSYNSTPFLHSLLTKGKFVEFASNIFSSIRFGGFKASGCGSGLRGLGFTLTLKNLRF